MLLSSDQYPQPEAPMSDTLITATAAAIEAACDQRWAVWLSDTGTWWATRTRPLTAEQIISGCVPCLRADDPDELATSIGEQDTIGPPSQTQTRQPITAPEPGVTSA